MTVQETEIFLRSRPFYVEHTHIKYSFINNTISKNGIAICDFSIYEIKKCIYMKSILAEKDLQIVNDGSRWHFLVKSSGDSFMVLI